MTTTNSLPEFFKKLDQFGSKVRKRAVRRSLAAGAREFRGRARQSAPARTGNLRRSIGIGRNRKLRSDSVGYTVRVQKPRARYKGKNVRNRVHYGYWVQAGHLVRTSGQRVQGGHRYRTLLRQRLRRGGARFVPGNPFMHTAYRSGRGAALHAFTQRMKQEIEKARP